MTRKTTDDRSILNSRMIFLIWVLLLGDLIIVHGCIRGERNEAIKVSKEVTLKIKLFEGKYDTGIIYLNDKLLFQKGVMNDHKYNDIHYGRVKK